MRLPALLLGTLLLAVACTPDDKEDEARGGGNSGDGAAEVCGADSYTNHVGQSRDVLALMTFPTPMRLIGPGDAVTMDHLPQRLNIVYGEDDLITRVYCG